MAIYAVLILVISLAFAVTSRAQEIELQGTVTDPNGKALAQASIQLLMHRIVVSKAVSETDGSFVIKVVSQGHYDLKADAFWV